MKTRRFILVLVAIFLFTAAFPAFASAASNSQYLKSAREIKFSANDAVSATAASLTAGKDSTEEKAMAVYSYIVKNFDYDWDLYNDVVSGRVTTYTPNPARTLGKGVGVCYDIASLYAAMLRSQGIACKMVKGYASTVNSYHAWNEVYDEETGRWVAMDLTYDMMKSGKARTSYAKLSGSYKTSKTV